LDIGNKLNLNAACVSRYLDVVDERLGWDMRRYANLMEQINDIDECIDTALMHFKPKGKGRRIAQYGEMVIFYAEVSHLMVFNKYGSLTRGGYYLTAIKNAMIEHGVAIGEDGIVTRIKKTRKNLKAFIDEELNETDSQQRDMSLALSTIARETNSFLFEDENDDGPLTEEDMEFFENKDVFKIGLKYSKLFTKNNSSS
jgi:hypothetical protein